MISIVIECIKTALAEKVNEGFTEERGLIESSTGLHWRAQGRRTVQQQDAQALHVVKLFSILSEQELVIPSWVMGCEVKEE